MPSHCSDPDCACDCRMEGKELEKYDLKIEKIRQEIFDLIDANELLREAINKKSVSKKSLVEKMIRRLNNMEV